jgi:two-component system, LuxR family, response regulator FixJ
VRTEPTVFIVDDDEQVRKSLSFLIASAGFQAETYSSAEELLAAYDPRWPGCILLDIRMDGMGGLELQSELQTRGIRIPVIIISGFADVPSVVRAVKNGAVDVLEKPFQDEALLERVQAAIERDRQGRQTGTQLTTRIASLSTRQREVMQLLLTGKGTKEIARDLGISTKTLEKHRALVLTKMGVESVVELMRLVLAPDLPASLAANNPSSQASDSMPVPRPAKSDDARTN